MGFWRREPERLDPHELGARRSDPGLAAFEPLPPNPRRVGTKNLLAYFVLGVLVVALIREGAGRGGPPVDGSCTKAAFALDKTDVASYGVLKWSATGPADSKVVFAIDTSTLPTSAGNGLLLGPVALTGCRAHGRFGVPVAAGDHVVTVFTVRPGGAAVVLGTAKLTVNPP